MNTLKAGMLVRYAGTSMAMKFISGCGAGIVERVYKSERTAEVRFINAPLEFEGKELIIYDDLRIISERKLARMLAEFALGVG